MCLHGSAKHGFITHKYVGDILRRQQRCLANSLNDFGGAEVAPHGIDGYTKPAG
jgi:hypothetical protein